ncbi:hypothetical protein [Paenibacillus polymyxa]|uniref:hypothetical protein n=1 Tax=Paenibacillus polymyxa TaxID=1406 RepID=UPI002ED2CA38|nr:hypothetical protein [Paenibacillus polymyxa]
MSKPNIDEIAAALSEELNPLYIQEGIALTEEFKKEGKSTHEAIRHADSIALKIHNERFTTELIKRVFDTLK